MFAIVGGSGFLGTRLADRLSKSKAGFVIIDKVNSAKYPDACRLADVRDLNGIQAVIPDGSILVNLAAEHRDDVTPRRLYDEVNIQGAVNLCAVADLRKVKTIIFTSSVAVYGFAPLGADEAAPIAPFNDYGRTKAEAELVYRRWQSEDPDKRSLVIVRPTVIFGEGNRGNVFNLMRQISARRFVMVGDGKNRKSIAYVENVAAFLHFTADFPPGVHIFNYVDKPDFTMSQLVSHIRGRLGHRRSLGIRMPFLLALSIGRFFDLLSAVTGKKFSISSVRVRKFCANSVYRTAVDNTDFTPPFDIVRALDKTVAFEFRSEQKKG